ncbi:uncharacterized protein LTR77_000896 [Saxophila tyrrhenica]|uniref:Enoyl reductase (ER) domain-containing protein n=1 Tax=Saxophila tyrrhenica TaxID=1690608 RepID=A0AAV9PPL5_9PEZI|nr:hypothetical protein LTR77_000896 [Saxophila tyrrhenica]
MPSINRAAWLHVKGEKLQVGDAAMPEPGEGEVVIRNKAIAINPVSNKIQDIGIIVQQWPTILDYDVSGEVHAVGPGVENVQQGDRVVAFVFGPYGGDPRFGAYQLYSVARAEKTKKLPDDVTLTDASVLPVGFNTAIVGLCGPPGQGLGLPLPSLSPEPSGKTLVIWGASSAVGLQSLQVARAAGVTTIAIASPHNFDLCRSCGAAELFDYHQASVVDDVVKAVKASNGEFAGVLDCISLPEDSYKFCIPILEALGGGLLGVLDPQARLEVSENIKVVKIMGMNEMTDAVWDEYLIPALREGKHRCLPEPLLAGEGLESLQKGMDILKKGVSAKKMVVTL